jgi:uncharacterized protein YndB with AHSA1/START domain
MSSIVTNTIQIAGPLAPVFDLVTTTRFWPQWHPATTGVGGVTERPFQLGDRIRERAQIGTRTYEGTWTVIDYGRPYSATLRGASDRIAITYTLQSDGQATCLSRQLEYHPEDFAASVTDPTQLDQLMYAQSNQALQKLKALIEEILAEEDKLTIA